MGLQVNTPRFSAYLGSKAALDAFSRSIASEILEDRVAISTVYMPLVRTPMIEPSAHYRDFPSLSPEEAASMVADAIANRRKRATTIAGRLAEATYQTAPGSRTRSSTRATSCSPTGEGAQALGLGLRRPAALG